MGHPINKLTIEGFKSIRKLEGFPLHSVNILIGSNGSGKSNFLSFFQLLAEMAQGRLQRFVATHGGPEAYLYLGSKTTTEISAQINFSLGYYECHLEPTTDNRLILGEETIYLRDSNVMSSFGDGPESLFGQDESHILASPLALGFHPSISRWTVCHFHDKKEW